MAGQKRVKDARKRVGARPSTSSFKAPGCDKAWMPATSPGMTSHVALLRRRARHNQRIVIEHWREPFFGLGHSPVLAGGIVFDLIALDLADAEIIALRMAEIEPANGSARPHSKAFGQLDPDPPLALEQGKQCRLLAVVGLRGIARRGTDATIFFSDQLCIGERFVRRVGPEVAAHALVQSLGESFGQS